jgi:hypothetical protein
MITIKQVNNDKKGMKDFIHFPYSLYRNDENWCPPLIMERKKFFSAKNPFMSHGRIAYFVAYEEGRPVGRVTAHTDEVYDKHYNIKQGFFGFFEAADNFELASLLIRSAEDWLRSNGIQTIMGPCSFSLNHEVGFLIKGFERPPVLMMPYTKKYYPGLFYKMGYRKEKELIAYRLGRETVTETPEIITRISKEIKDKFGDSIEIRNLDMKYIKPQLKIILDIYNEAWSKNWGFVPMTEEEMNELGKELKYFAYPEIIYTLYKDGEPAACLLAFPDINEMLIHIKNGKLFPTGIFKLLFFRKYVKTGRLILMGVKSKFRNMRLDVLLYQRLFEDALSKTEGNRLSSIHDLEMSWILEDNIAMNAILESLKADPYKRYLILKKTLGGMA